MDWNNRPQNSSECILSCAGSCGLGWIHAWATIWVLGMKPHVVFMNQLYILLQGSFRVPRSLVVTFDDFRASCDWKLIGSHRTLHVYCSLSTFLKRIINVQWTGFAKIHTMDGKPPPATWVVKKKKQLFLLCQTWTKDPGEFHHWHEKMMGAYAGCKKTNAACPFRIGINNKGSIDTLMLLMVLNLCQAGQSSYETNP